jgi:hypothetical protein
MQGRVNKRVIQAGFSTLRQSQLTLKSLGFPKAFRAEYQGSIPSSAPIAPIKSGRCGRDAELISFP